MPKPNGRTWRHCRAKMDITSNQAASLLDIAGGSLRQIETNVKPVSLALAYRAARLYGVQVSDLIDEDSEKPPKDQPDKKPPEPKVEPVGPPKRRNGRDDRRGPKRVHDAVAAAS